MTDTVLSITEIENFFQASTTRMLGLDPNAPANQKRVRVAWPSKGAPAWKHEENVVFLMIGYADDSITRQMDVSYDQADVDNANRTVSYTRVIHVSWTCYGPNSFNDADLIRSNLFLPKTKADLAAVNLALIIDVPMPMRTPELFASQWWDRTSFFARFNEKVIRQSEVPYLQSADVRIIEG
ncbi:hypothetical protein GC093_20505 [Paenibacillus sp. LMG 31456]|uniref:Phage neck terminator protein gp12-like domain-containing protein n=1 Tax=Paenibacillus foliorum TaxID=2654974 RepID=A0A972GSM5_9BACL|nr:hypothetical protein [Paenibacillus foliorum]NOU95593.1 hypothetical protein [Paenibacillus foliorum]